MLALQDELSALERGGGHLLHTDLNASGDEINRGRSIGEQAVGDCQAHGGARPTTSIRAELVDISDRADMRSADERHN